MLLAALAVLTSDSLTLDCVRASERASVLASEDYDCEKLSFRERLRARQRALQAGTCCSGCACVSYCNMCAQGTCSNAQFLSLALGFLTLDLGARSNERQFDLAHGTAYRKLLLFPATEPLVHFGLIANSCEPIEAAAAAAAAPSSASRQCVVRLR